MQNSLTELHVTTAKKLKNFVKGKPMSTRKEQGN